MGKRILAIIVLMVLLLGMSATALAVTTSVSGEARQAKTFDIKREFIVDAGIANPTSNAYFGVHLDKKTAEAYKGLVSQANIAYLAIANDGLNSVENEPAGKGQLKLPIGNSTEKNGSLLNRTLTVTVPSGDDYSKVLPSDQNYPVVLEYNIRRTVDSSGLTDGITYNPKSDDVFIGKGAALYTDANSDTAFKLRVTVFYSAKGYDTAIALYPDYGKGEKQETISYVDTFSDGSLTVMKKSANETFDPNIEFDVEVTFTATAGNVIENYLIKGDTAYTFTGRDLTGMDDTSIKVNLDARLYHVYAGPSTYGGQHEGFAARTTNQTLTVPFKLKHNTQVTFSNIPAGVTYEVTEILPAGYDGPEYLNANGTIVGGVTTEATITNTMTDYVEPDTGIALDSLPYILILGVVGVGMILLLMKRRTREDN